MQSQRLAVLIDADNSPAAMADGLFAEVAKYGEASVRRIYGDFASPRLQSWRAVLPRHAITPTQQFAYTSGKNASDITLVIEAMDLLHGGRVDGFCLVSSDSDFTRLASRIREQGLVVYGFGAARTPPAFRMACSRFILIENLADPAPAAAAPPEPAPPQAEPAPKPPRELLYPDHDPASALPREPPSRAVPLILRAMGQMEDSEGWYDLGELGTVLLKLQPDFDPRTYGHTKLSTLIAKTGMFEGRGPKGAVHAVARKPAKPAKSKD